MIQRLLELHARALVVQGGMRLKAYSQCVLYICLLLMFGKENEYIGVRLRLTMRLKL